MQAVKERRKALPKELTDALKVRPVDVLWRPHGFVEPRRVRRPAGLSLHQIAESIPHLPRDVHGRGVMFVTDGESEIKVARELWPFTKPKAGMHVFIDVPLQGGGQGGLLASVAMIAVLVAAAAVSGGALAALAPGVLPGLGGSFLAAGTLGAKIAAGAIALGGMLAIQALTAVPSSRALTGSSDTDTKTTASVEGNALRPGLAPPYVGGTAKVFPPFIVKPLREFIGDDSYVTAAYALAGPHDLDDLKAGGVPFDDIDELEYQIRNGFETDSAISLIARQSFTDQLQVKLSEHQVNKDTQDSLADQTNPATCIPTEHAFRTGDSPDEFWIPLSFAGLIQTDAPDLIVAVPFRLSLQLDGGGVVNIPEFHINNHKSMPFVRSIRVIWRAAPNGGVPVDHTNDGTAKQHNNNSSNDGFYLAYKEAPNWSAHSYFSAGSGNDVLTNSNGATTKVRNIELVGDRINIYIDPATFAKGRYIARLKRGAVYKPSGFNSSTYILTGVSTHTGGENNPSTISGKTDFFRWNYDGTNKYVAWTVKNVVHSVTAGPSSSIWNERALPPGNFATIAVRVKNHSLGAVSTIASAYVYDYNAATGLWDNLITTSNPAPHFRNVLAGALNADPVPESLLDDDALIDWRTHCISEGYEVNAVIENKTCSVAANLIAGAGYARLTQSELFGVMLDKDRSGESPVQIFTPRNSRSYRFEKQFIKLPSGLRCIFRDADEDYAETEIIVMDPDGDLSDRLEEMRYDMFTDEDAVRSRALFDMAQGRLRMTFHRFESNAQAIKCRRGDLIGLNQIVLGRQYGSAYIVEVITSGSNITGLRLDGSVPVYGDGYFTAADSYFTTLEDTYWTGASCGVEIRLKDPGGYQLAYAEAEAAEDDEITFDPALAGPIAGLEVGCLVITGPINSTKRRLILGDITPKAGDGHPHVMTAVDEAPALWA